MLPLLAFLVATSAECIIMALIPTLNLFTAIAWGATLIIAGLYLSRSHLIIVFLANLAVLYLVLGFNSTMVFMLFFGFAGLIMSYLTNLGKDYYYMQNSGVIIAILGISIFLIFFYYGTEQVGLANRQAELNAYMKEAIVNFEQSDLYDSYEEQGLIMEDIESSFNEMVTIIFKHLPALFYLQAIMVVFLMLFLAQLVSQTLSIERLRKKAFTKEIMPWQLVWVFIAGLGLWIWGREQTSAIYYVGSNILAVIAPIALYYGLAVALYLLSRTQMKKNIWLIILTIIFILVFTVPVIIMVGLIGIFDALIDYRKIRLQKEV